VLELVKVIDYLKLVIEKILTGRSSADFPNCKFFSWFKSIMDVVLESFHAPQVSREIV